MRRTWVVVAGLVGMTAACTGGGAGAPTADPTGAAGAGGSDTAIAPVPQGAAQLTTFSSCDELLAYFQQEALERVGPYGLGAGGVYFGDAQVAEESAAMDSAAGSSAAIPAPDSGVAQVAPPAFSGTNVQEEGVDEPDLVKTDGTIIVAVAQGRVRVVDAATATELATIPLPADAWGHELLLAGTDLLILSTGSPPWGGPIPLDDTRALVPAFGPVRTTVTKVDLTDPAAPEVVGTMRIEGGYRSARLVGTVARLVVGSQPTGLLFTQPTDAGLGAEREAEEVNRGLVEDSTIDDWVPHYELAGPDGQPGEIAPLIPCDALAQPREFAGFSTLGVVTFDLAGDLAPTSAAGVVAEGETVYASPTSLYVATSQWGAWAQPFWTGGVAPEPEEITTDLHRFDISDPAATSYVASGTVAGTLLNQFALDEQDGVLRAAVTRHPEWVTGQPSSSSIHTFRTDGDTLAEVGRLEGLGSTEQIYAVRYLGNLAAVVTFRQTDPLFLVDLTDPAAPALLGELQIPGYSAYLHPVGDGRLLGVGQDANPETGEILGVQASLFDISNPAAPSRIAQVQLGQGWTPVESDHRAFLYWPATGSVVLPTELYPPFIEGQEQQEQAFSGAVVLHADAASLAETGRIQHRPDSASPDFYAPPVQRALVIGDDLWTLSDAGLARNDLASLTREALVTF